MSKETDLLLGIAFSLLTQSRAYMIKNQHMEGLELIEDQYQAIKDGIERNYLTKGYNNG
jgi:hypothetical protein